MLKIFSKEPLNRFLYLKDNSTSIPVGTFQNLPLQEILAA